MTAIGLYQDLVFPPGPGSRPHVAINMVATIDGKTISGERNEPVMDLGSSVDHATMRNLEFAAGAVLIGAETLRATPKLHYDEQVTRMVATRIGNLPWDHRFFTDAGTVFVLCPDRARLPLELSSTWIELTDWQSALGSLRQQHGVDALLVEGGSELNAQLLSADLVDELFLTISPRIKLGRDVPTFAGGEPLDRELLKLFQLTSCNSVQDEVFLRYRRFA